MTSCVKNDLRRKKLIPTSRYFFNHYHFLLC